MLLATQQQNLRYVFTSFLLFFSMPALATTLMWQGPYAGVYVGAGVGNNRVSSNVGGVTSSSYLTNPTDVNAVTSAGAWEKNAISSMFGIQVGHDWVFNQMVYGVVLDYSTLSLSSSNTTTNTYADGSGQYSVHTAMQTNWFSTLRARVGYPTLLRHFPSLLYLTGGMTLAGLKVNNSFNDTLALAGASGNTTSQNQIGWAAGAGIEIATYRQITVDFEYLYVRVPSVTTAGFIYNSAPGFGIPAQSMNNAFSSTANFHANILKIGLNYRLNE